MKCLFRYWLLLGWMFCFHVNLHGQRPIGSTENNLLKLYKPFSDSTSNKINKYFDKFARWGNFNGTYLMFKNDSMIYGSRGYANWENKDSVFADDLFQLASVSKIFTGISVMMLHQDGQLNIDDSVHWYLPELKRTNLTIRHLLSHTSGLPDYFYYNYKDFELPEGQGHMKNEDVLQMVNMQGDKKFANPGFYDYCNTNYALLSLIVERVSEQGFRTFVRDNICKPADMKFTHICNFDSIPLTSYTVQGYNEWGLFNDVMFNGTTGDKGVYSNVFEMFQLSKALRSSYILHENTKREMWTPHTVSSADGYYALGWRIRWIDGKKWAFHNGWWKGFRTYFWHCIDENKTIVALTNNVNGPFLRTIELVSLLK